VCVLDRKRRELRLPATSACSPGPIRPPYAARGFGGYACRDDRCILHKAGFDWAERNGIADPAACTPPREPAFVEGCRAYAEDAVTAEQAGFDWARENEIDDPCDCTAPDRASTQAAQPTSPASRSDGDERCPGCDEPLPGQGSSR
jgi:hypothetical protein